MILQENVSLAPYTTFGVGGPARYFARVQEAHTIGEIFAFAREKKLPLFVLGGGSNILVSDEGFPGMVVHIENKGFELYEHTAREAICEGAAGEIWDDVVARVVSEDLWGVENLSYIPGTLGAAPIQNIGAYGQEISTMIEAVEAYDIEQGEMQVFSAEKCQFGYRKSIFNTNARGKFLVTSVTFRLTKSGTPHMEYHDVAQHFADKGPDYAPTVEEMREAVVTIRINKLPDPATVGNAGSFFKNLQLSSEEYETLETNVAKNFDEEKLEKLREIKDRINPESNPSASAKATADNPRSRRVKIPTAYLIDICGLKGAHVGGARVSEKQALVLTNPEGKATAADVLELAGNIREEVLAKTGMTITNEPQLVGFIGDTLEEVPQ